MIKTRDVYIVFTLLIALITGCKHGDVAETHKNEDKHGDEIIFSHQQAKNAGLKVETIKSTIFTAVIECSGDILAAPGDAAEVVAPTSGIIYYVSNAITEGANIVKGEALFRISSKTVDSGDAAYKAMISYKTAQIEYKRAENLVKDKIISDKEFEKIKLSYENTKAAYEALGSPNSDGTSVNSPQSGYISSISVKNGDYVTVGDRLATVSKNSKLQLRAEVEKEHYRQLSQVRTANFRVPYDEKIYRLTDMGGRIISYGKSTSSDNNYIPVIFEFDNTEHILSGTFADVYLLTSEQKEAVSVPESALSEEMGIYYVYLQTDDEDYIKREIKTGTNNGERIEIISGVKPGDKVV
ncbi:MAG: efflux RND transporter periplasmic adaptor subunit, partial [Bacteroidales bacterium]